MTPDQTLRFIVIDDNKLDCFIADKIIRYGGMFEDVKLFTEATVAIAFIETNNPPEIICKTIIILDIQMPIMNGFAFMEEFEKLPENLRLQYAVFMVSSSVNERDRDRVAEYPSIRLLMNKPFNKELLSKMISHLG
ncbi:MAG: response regulator [Sphingobacteriaceae bacterium]